MCKVISYVVERGTFGCPYGKYFSYTILKNSIWIQKLKYERQNYKHFMKKIQEWLGHSTPVTTETIYAHLNVKHKDETAWIANDCLTLKLPESIKAGAF